MAMDENLVGYLLNSLDPATHERVESLLRANPQARQRLESLRQLLAPLEEDRDIQPPPDLLLKTLAHVAEHCSRELPRSPTPTQRPCPMSIPFWRRVDVAVAAGLLFAVVTMSFPVVARLRHNHAIVECQKNLSDYYQAVSAYHDVHKKLPNFNAEGPPRNVAGMIAPILHDAGVLNESASICCPATKGLVPCTTTLAQVGALTAEEFLQQAPRLLPCYAYSLGYFDGSGYHCAMDSQADCASRRVPLMADGPPPGVTGNSLNHNGRGQNVLFNDGHVEFCVSRHIIGDDIYLNRDLKVAAGLDCGDAVLGSSAAHP